MGSHQQLFVKFLYWRTSNIQILLSKLFIFSYYFLKTQRSLLLIRLALSCLWIFGVRSQKIYEEEGVSSPSLINLKFYLSDFIIASVLALKQNLPSWPEATKFTDKWRRINNQVSWFRSCQSVWLAYQNLYTWSRYTMVQMSRDFTVLETLFIRCWYVVNRLHLCRMCLKETFILRR